MFVGRFTSEKGLPLLLDAWRQVNTSVPLVIVGDGPLRETLEAQAAQSGGSRVIFRGHLSREETLATIKGAKVLVCASECYEQGPATILEAYACGVPVIAPSLGPIDEVVQDKQTGLLFRAGDRAHLAQQVTWALSHEEQLQSMGRRARAKYESTYNDAKNYARLMEIYERVLAGTRQQAAVPDTLDQTRYQASRVASA